ncbi:hypothetical protein, partial [Streptomyces sp. MBT60]|uniref:hypothetical protein n=1 Tax=Streptomyces sp. MBT60 TaxID=2800409 RepID=UPI00190C879A
MSDARAVYEHEERQAAPGAEYRGLVRAVAWPAADAARERASAAPAGSEDRRRPHPNPHIPQH